VSKCVALAAWGRVGHDAPVAGDVNPLRAVPSVERLLRHEAAAALVQQHRRERVVEAVRLVLADLRETLVRGGQLPSDELLLEQSAIRLASPPRLEAVVNATGVVLHTNLGRALLADDAIAAMTAAARHAVNLELDGLTGRRGDRDALLSDDLCALTGAESGLAVNNNAAAVLLALAALAGGREVVVSRGELVEIGGSFRMPDVMAISGARLREVGTTNRTHADDYRQAIGPDTGLLVKVHTSNYRIVGFTSEVGLAELAQIGRAAGVPVLDDLGSGALLDLTRYGLPAEPVVHERIAAGADLVCFSGDKLLGGPQAGIVVGRRALVERLAAHPLRRALRLDKLRLAALGATLRLYRDAPDLPAVLPTLRWLTRPVQELEAIGRVVAPRLAARLGDGWCVTMIESEAEVGSGAAPTCTIPSRALAIVHPDRSPEDVASRFRAASPPILGRIHAGRFLLDLRGVFAVEDLLP
jgi:L-seryl-tRNA(Ser) seleniumtransferase